MQIIFRSETTSEAERCSRTEKKIIICKSQSEIIKKKQKKNTNQSLENRCESLNIIIIQTVLETNYNMRLKINEIILIFFYTYALREAPHRGLII